MLQFVWSLLLLALIVVPLTWLIVKTSKWGLSRSRTGDGSKVVYVIQFFNLDVLPDLSKSSALMEVLKIQLTNQESYVVESTVSDKQIKDLIQKEFSLTDKDLVVFSKNFMQSV